MKIDHFHGTVVRIEERYAVLLLDNGEEKPVLLSALPRQLKLGEQLCRQDDRWITEKEAQKKRNGRIRSLRGMLRGD
ncbi:MAG: DUF3006 domain-containing protein [Oscillospiraceae bacterium]|nr:DUF3006 domain-containing protein [Oscillospiraceae bacterium]